MKPAACVAHVTLVRLVVGYRVRCLLRRMHDWVATHFMGLVIGVCLGVITPVGVGCYLLNIPQLASQGLLVLFFGVLGILIVFGSKTGERDRAGAAAAASYARQRARQKLRRQHPSLRKVPDSMLDDLFQP